MRAESKDDDDDDAKSDKATARDPESLVPEFREHVFGTSCSREMRAFCERRCAEIDWAAVDASAAGEQRARARRATRRG